MPASSHPEDAPVSSSGEVAPKTVRNFVRNRVLDAWAALSEVRGATRRGLALPRVHLLCLHDVFQDEEAPFRSLVASLAKDHEFVSYSEAVRRVLAGGFPRPAIAFSFDDGFRTMRAAAAILEEFGARGCFFLCPPIVGETRAAEAARFCRERLLTRPREFLSWNDVERLAASGHEIGGHTQTHPRLADIGDAQLADELGSCWDALRARFGSVRHFAWPFGHFTDIRAGVPRLVFKAGFESCASAERGCHIVPATAPENLCLRRENVVAAWPPAHVRFFLGRSALRAGPSDNLFPHGLN
jgi:peptidoglycan/xylan/chitin deacetylase (PgdA/CDA1 family)